MDEASQQQKIHDAVELAMRENDLLDDDHLLTGWILSYETVTMGDSRPNCGHLYGPPGMTTWRSLGIVEWVRRFCLRPDEDESDDA